MRLAFLSTITRAPGGVINPFVANRHAGVTALSLCGWIVLLWLVGRCDFALGQQPVPPLQAPVTDLTATLTQAQRAKLSERLLAFEQSKGSQLFVLIVSTTAPEAIEQYALRVAETWAIGREDIDDGVLLLIATDDRALRIEVGYGLEGAIPDVTANRVIDEFITPSFRAGDFYAGIDNGVERLLGLIDGEPLPEPDWRAPGAGSGGNLPLLPILFFLLPFSGSLSHRIGRLPAALVSGSVFGVVGYFSIGLIAAVAMFAIGFIFALNSRAGLGNMAGSQSRRRSEGWGPGGVFTGGRGGSGGGFGGGFGGGGGGGFGGGGASGRW